MILSGGEVVGHVTSSFDSPVLGHAVLLGWLRQRLQPRRGRPVVEIDGRTATVAEPAVLRPGGGPCPRLSRSAAGGSWPGPRPWTRCDAGRRSARPCGWPPDDLLLIGAERGTRGATTPTPSSSPEPASSAWTLDAAALRSLVRAPRRVAPARRPAGAGPGPDRRVPAKLWLQEDGSARLSARRLRPSSGAAGAGARGAGRDERVRRDAAGPAAGAEPKRSYDVVIIGGGGHGLATAYHLAARHGITERRRARARLHRLGQLRSQHHHHPRPTTASPRPCASTSTAWSCTSAWRTRPAATSCTPARASSGWPTRSPPPAPSRAGRSSTPPAARRPTTSSPTRSRRICPQIDLTGGGRYPVLGASYHHGGGDGPPRPRRLGLRAGRAARAASTSCRTPRSPGSPSTAAG